MNPQIPALTEAKKLSPTQVALKWSDGHEGVYSAALIRRSCRCAHCVNELTGERMLDPRTVSDNLTVEKIALVGRYALSFAFGDQHGSGIYPYRLLWEICPCPSHPPS